MNKFTKSSIRYYSSCAINPLNKIYFYDKVFDIKQKKKDIVYALNTEDYANEKINKESCNMGITHLWHKKKYYYLENIFGRSFMAFNALNKRIMSNDLNVEETYEMPTYCLKTKSGEKVYVPESSKLLFLHKKSNKLEKKRIPSYLNDHQILHISVPYNDIDLSNIKFEVIDNANLKKYKLKTLDIESISFCGYSPTLEFIDDGNINKHDKNIVINGFVIY